MVVYMNTDSALNTCVLRTHPIPGPIITQYVYGKFKPTIIEINYRHGASHTRGTVPDAVAEKEFWGLVNTYRFPSKYDVFRWARDMCRHIICMSKFFNGELGPLTDGNFMLSGLRKLTGCFDDFDAKTCEQNYAALYENTVIKDDTEVYKKAAAAVSSILSKFNKHKEEVVDIRSMDTELLLVLNRHICEVFQKTVIKLHRKGKPVQRVITSQAYEDALFVDGFGRDVEHWFRFPSVFYNNEVHLLESNKQVAHFTFKTEELSDERIESLQTLIFYSQPINPQGKNLNKMLVAFKGGDLQRTINSVDVQELNRKKKFEAFNLAQVQRMLYDDSESEDEDDFDEAARIQEEVHPEEIKKSEKTTNQTLILLAGAAVVCAVAFS